MTRVQDEELLLQMAIQPVKAGVREFSIDYGTSKYAEAIVIEKTDHRVGGLPEKHFASGVARKNGASNRCSDVKLVEKRGRCRKVIPLQLNHRTSRA